MKVNRKSIPAEFDTEFQFRKGNRDSYNVKTVQNEHSEPNGKVLEDTSRETSSVENSGVQRPNVRKEHRCVATRAQRRRAQTGALASSKTDSGKQTTSLSKLGSVITHSLLFWKPFMAGSVERLLFSKPYEARFDNHSLFEAFWTYLQKGRHGAGDGEEGELGAEAGALGWANSAP